MCLTALSPSAFFVPCGTFASGGVSPCGDQRSAAGSRPGTTRRDTAACGGFFVPCGTFASGGVSPCGDQRSTAFRQ
ncbi:MAG: hypothetical protein E7057_06905 [Lentisphaerae bacterium]|nr:hypothetical protein [Lentisphaerota bacterium]